MNIYIVRHGQTHNNLKGRYYGKLDVPLNQVGMEQMEKLEPSLRGIQFDNVYSSDTRRTLESLKIAAGHLYHKVQIDERLAELNFGDFEGKTYQEICTLFPQYINQWNENWKSFCPPNGESFSVFYMRVSSFFKQLLEIKANNILIMTHSGVVKAIYCYVLQNNPDLYWNFTSHNGTINLIKYEDGNLFIDLINKGEL